MNLIEQLGGYDASKNILLRKRYDHIAYSVDSDSFYDHEAVEHGGIDLRNLDDDLLEYRRENNIFEVGDLVVFSLLGNEVIQYADWLKSQNQDWIRHATNEEINRRYKNK